MYRISIVLLSFSLLIMAAIAVADHHEGQEMSEEMPPMGPPEEMKQLSQFVGDWDAVGRFRMTPEEDWQDYTGSCTYKYIADGAILLMEYKAEMMGMAFSGYGWQCWDREKKEWQSTWADNMGGRITMYTGQKEGNKTVMTGDDLWQGQAYKTRMTTFDETDKSFKWLMEHSMDGGQIWYTGMEATYTKK
jgi:hypothetical protein